MIENREFAAFTRRIVARFAARAGSDIDMLPVLRDIQDEIDTLMRASIAKVQTDGYSWADIARRLGVTRQAAQQRYGNTRASR